ncbi:MAG: integrase core domain-containing protein, partial [Nitrospinota bacterium]
SCLQADRRQRAEMRDELLNLERFDTLNEAKVLVERWRHVYDRIRPHSSLGYRPPAPRNERTMASGHRSASLFVHGSRTLIGSGTTIGGR